MPLCKETMIRSYSNISFSPERRGESDFNYYTEMLATDLATLGENQGNYERKFVERVMLIYHRQARCASAMITGPANFPFRKNQKNNEAQRRAEDDFTHWRNKYFKAVNRVRTLSPEAEIDKTLNEIDDLTARKETYKAANKLKTREEREAYLIEHYKLGERETRYLDNAGQFLPFPIDSITLKIRERKKKLEIMKVRSARKATFEPIAFDGGCITIEEDRVMIKHDDKPERAVIDAIKARGFRWSPNFKAWVRKHTGNALYDAQQVIKTSI